jgi:hypothetical protein
MLKAAINWTFMAALSIEALSRRFGYSYAFTDVTPQWSADIPASVLTLRALLADHFADRDACAPTQRLLARVIYQDADKLLIWGLVAHAVHSFK